LIRGQIHPEQGCVERALKSPKPIDGGSIIAKAKNVRFMGRTLALNEKLYVLLSGPLFS
jgi:hypothetical protein